MAITKLYNKTGDEKAVEIQNNLEKNFGFVPETFQAMGRNGNFLEGVLKVMETAGSGLDGKTKELIAIAVSAANGCSYCIDAHRALAKQQGITDEEITAAIEMASMMSLFNTYNKSIGLNHDIKAD
ncbi:alkylhydroperoxidase AhpD family core domain protein [Sedimentisphaera cyanobacteriorum]|uniref:Alkylhydroperoxidase AhpD family core domain protein n=1 Tax=Sedimentisphaera cyanobacteriorum TaxID=1940790 RepID=A0A1Q2HNC4_9BACT|nr:carboxymuconolactone decarboxylase family protein [Sedimentisphaera cyanobacteriorum]AQQ08932.1 alkylhydroperoxidase AhpD family core domain protein [Sedimentisphaera cyanobacteriorum]